MKKSKFWLESPKALFSDTKVLPDQFDDINDKLNTLTKLVIIIAIVLAIFGWRYWLAFLIIALLVILAVYLLNQIEHNGGRDGEPISNRSNVRTSDKIRREGFNEDLNNFTYYANNIQPPKIEPEKVQVKSNLTKTGAENPNINGITMMTDLELELKPLDECYVHIKASESRTKPMNANYEITFITELGHVGDEDMTAETVIHEVTQKAKQEPFNIANLPKPQLVIQTKETRDKAPRRPRARKTASDLAREAYLQDYKADEVDMVEKERQSMINGLL